MNEAKTCFASEQAVIDELLKYKQLLDMGAITKQEFEAKKRTLLSTKTKPAAVAPTAPAPPFPADGKCLSKEENKEAFDVYWKGSLAFGSKCTHRNLSPEEMIGQFNALFHTAKMTPFEKKKVQQVCNFTIGGSRACFNTNRTAVLMCEMPASMTLGMTRNMCIYDITSNVCYHLKSGIGYKTMRNYFNSLQQL